MNDINTTDKTSSARKPFNFRLILFVFSELFAVLLTVAASVFVSVRISDTVPLILAVLCIALISAASVVLIALGFRKLYIDERIKDTYRPLEEIRAALESSERGRATDPITIPDNCSDEIAGLCGAVNGMLTAMKSLDRMRSDFMSGVSHDMRTPMTTISGFIDCILDGAIDASKQEHYLRLIKSEVMRLSRLVSSLLDIARIQAGDRQFIMEPFDICETARVILFSFENLIDEKKLSVDFEADSDNLYVNADADAIHQVIYNIVDNAVKFSRPGSELSISLSRDGKGNIVTSVKNEGDGIAAEDLPFVFERFFKSDKTRGLDRNGSGLGMYIAKSIIDAHNGRIAVDSVPDSYCRFYFTLPEVLKPVKRRMNRYD